VDHRPAQSLGNPFFFINVRINKNSKSAVSSNNNYKKVVLSINQDNNRYSLRLYTMDEATCVSGIPS